MKRLLGMLSLVLLEACGGGAGTQAPAPATLSYVDPPGPGWRWTRNATLSTPTRMVLELQGPGPGTVGRGVHFQLKADLAAVSWGAPRTGSASRVEDLAFNQGTGLAVARTRLQDGLFKAGVFRFQQGDGSSIPLDAALVRVVLEPTPALRAGTSIAFSAPVLRYLPARGRVMTEQACAVGALISQ